MITVDINGTAHSVPEDSSLLKIVETLGIDAATVVADVSGEIIPRESFAAKIIHEGDAIELVRIVGGG